MKLAISITSIYALFMPTVLAKLGINPMLRQLEHQQESVETTNNAFAKELFADNKKRGHSAIQSSAQSSATQKRIPNPNVSFEGISTADQILRLGKEGPGIPPDPVGDVGPKHYVQMVNSAYAVFDKEGNRLKIDTLGSLWEGSNVTDCTRNDGDPIVLYDQFEDRWILMQFTNRCKTENTPCYLCFAVSTSGDPTGDYHKYAVLATDDPNSDGQRTLFPDYPKISVWSDSYILTTTDSSPTGFGGVSVYALEKKKMIAGDPSFGVENFFEESGPRVGNGLLAADIDGDTLPPPGSPVPIFGDQDDDSPFFNAAFDAINVWELFIDWETNNNARLEFRESLPVASFDTDFPCGPNSRDCLPQPGLGSTESFLDVLSYRQRLLYRLAYRNFGRYESIVATRSVEARSNVAGMRWYEVKRDKRGDYSVVQQSTFSPDDGVNRWMGSIAQDAVGNIALGYSVGNVEVYPGIRYTGRLVDDPLNVMTLGEANLAIGSGSQLSPGSRWGDYSSMNIDPVDDCTFWYVNEYYTATGELAGKEYGANIGIGDDAGRFWQTRIGSFTLPGCERCSKSKTCKSKKSSKNKKTKTKGMKRTLKAQKMP